MVDKLDINKITKKELLAIPGLGKNIADAILKLREKSVKIRDLSQLKPIKGLNNKLYEQLTKQIEISPFRLLKFTKKELSFFGNSDLMTGHLPITNIGTKREHRVDIAFQNFCSDETSINYPIQNIRIRTRVVPDECKDLALDFSIPSTIPPGVYSADILVNEAKTKAKFYVAEKLSARITPAVFHIQTNPDTVITKQIFVANQGNVPITFCDPGPVFLGDPFMRCRVLKASVRELTEPKPLEDVIHVASQQIESHYKESGVLKITVPDSAPIKIDPGETCPILLTIQIPKLLKFPNRYLALYRFLDTAVQFQVTPLNPKVVIT